MATSIAIFRNSDFCLGALYLCPPWLMKYLHGAGYGVLSHHQLTSPESEANRVEEKNDNESIKIANNSSFIAITGVVFL